tara:strand:- start:1418 stop:1546 length:129 start_codon:yes stop_codon:yes gene_type:complete
MTYIEDVKRQENTNEQFLIYRVEALEKRIMFLEAQVEILTSK